MHGLGVDQVNIALNGKQRLPLVITPRWDDSVAFLKAWNVANRGWIDQALLEHGAILIRGFAIDTAAELEGVIQAFQPNLHNTYRGTSPRQLIDGTQYVFSAGT